MRDDKFWSAYKDPRWQKKRLEVMEAAGFACENCEDSKSTLNVHHRFYEHGKMPWEYDDSALECLCEKCHDEITKIRREIKQNIQALSTGGLMQVLGFTRGALMLDRKSDCVILDSAEALDGFVGAFPASWGICVSDVYVEMPQSGPKKNTFSRSALDALRSRSK